MIQAIYWVHGFSKSTSSSLNKLYLWIMWYFLFFHFCPSSEALYTSLSKALH